VSFARSWRGVLLRGGSPGAVASVQSLRSLHRRVRAVDLDDGAGTESCREFDTRFRWTGSKITEVLLGALSAVAISALACFVTYEVWAKPSVDSRRRPICSRSLGGRHCPPPDTGVVGSVFHASYLASGFTYIAFAADVAASATHSIAEALTTSLLLLLDLAHSSCGLERQLRQRCLVPQTPHAPATSGRSVLHADGFPAYPAYNEPPDLLIKTIEAAEAIDYPNFE